MAASFGVGMHAWTRGDAKSPSYLAQHRQNSINADTKLPDIVMPGNRVCQGQARQANRSG